MPLTFSDSALRIAVAKICLDVGWHSSHISALNVLSDILAHYLRQVSIAAVDYANHCGRSEPIIDDLASAFEHLAIDIGQLQDFVLNVDSSPFPVRLPFYPVPCRQNRVLDQCESSQEERPEYYDDWMPSLNLKKSTKLLTDSTAAATTTTATIANGNGNEETANLANLVDEKSDKNGIVDDAKEIAAKVDTDAIPETEIDDNKAATVDEDENEKKKLVLRFSLGKSFEEDENGGDKDSDANNASETNGERENTCAGIAKQLMSTRAFSRFLQSSLFLEPSNPDSQKSLRCPDWQRLVNNHESRPNSPEPESLNSSSILSGAIPNSVDGLLKPAETFDEPKKGKKNISRSKKSMKNEFDIDLPPLDFGDLESSPLTPVKASFKVKDIGGSGATGGGKKERKKAGESERKTKANKKLDGLTPLSIKVTGFGFADNISDHVPNQLELFGMEPKPPPLFDAMQSFVAGNLAPTAVGDEKPFFEKEKETPSKKRQYQKKERPKDYVERRGRKPKVPKAPLLAEKPPVFDETASSPFSLPPFLMNSGANLPVDTPIPSTCSPVGSKTGKRAGKKGAEIFGDNEAAKMLVLMSESNDASMQSTKDDQATDQAGSDNGGNKASLNKFANLHGVDADLFSKMLMAKSETSKPNATIPSDLSPSSSLLSSASSNRKSVGRPSTKRATKASISKKIKSAEMVESSGDSSSDNDEVNSNPVSLLPPPAEITMKNILSSIGGGESDGGLHSITATTAAAAERKRHPSASSVSSVSSAKSSASIAKVDIDLSASTSKSKVVSKLSIAADSLSPSPADRIDEKPSPSSIPKDGAVGKESNSGKHKKNKKHSKEKHRHHGDEKAHKKHKKVKPEKEAKESKHHKEHKERENKDQKEKSTYKPKLNIKFGTSFEGIKFESDSSDLVERVPFIADRVPTVTIDEPPKIDIPTYIAAADKSIDLSSNKKKQKGAKKKTTGITESTATPSELVFIKDPASSTKSSATAAAAAAAKESKSKTPIIFGNKLFEDGDKFNKITHKSTPKSRTKAAASDRKDAKRDDGKTKKEIDSTGTVTPVPSSVTKSKVTPPPPAAAAAPTPPLVQISVTTPDEKSKKGDRTTKKSPDEPVQCTVLRETIELVEPPICDDKVWICPTCKKADDGSPMIGCDSCEGWFHYFCVGINFDFEPNEDEPWFCPKCLAKRAKQLERAASRKSAAKSAAKQKGMMNRISTPDSVTITPIIPSAGTSASSSLLQPNVLSELSFFPVSASPSQKSALTITPTASTTPTTTTPGYKPTGRPRGRPRKDSNLTRQPNMTITPITNTTPVPIPAATTAFRQPILDSAYLAAAAKSQTNTPIITTTPTTSKKNPIICNQCRSSDFVTNPALVNCAKCSHWYHWVCVGVTSPPTTRWTCPKCRKRKAPKRTHWQANLSGHNKKIDDDEDDDNDDDDDDDDYIAPNQGATASSSSSSTIAAAIGAASTSTSSGSMSLTDAKFLALTGGLAGPSGSGSSKSRYHHHQQKRQAMSNQQTEQMMINTTASSTTATSKYMETPLDDDFECESTQNQAWRCATCQHVTCDGNETDQWIGCDECDQWHHFGCVGLRQAPPDDESWFCPKCIKRQKNIANKLAKIKRI